MVSPEKGTSGQADVPGKRSERSSQSTAEWTYVYAPESLRKREDAKRIEAFTAELLTFYCTKPRKGARSPAVMVSYIEALCIANIQRKENERVTSRLVQHIYDRLYGETTHDENSVEERPVGKKRTARKGWNKRASDYRALVKEYVKAEPGKFYYRLMKGDSENRKLVFTEPQTVAANSIEAESVAKVTKHGSTTENRSAESNPTSSPYSDAVTPPEGERHHSSRMADSQAQGMGSLGVFSQDLLDQHAEIIGRRSQIDDILRFIRESSNGIVLLRGEPGIGKTALLAHLVLKFRESLPAGRVSYYPFRRDSAQRSLISCFRCLTVDVAARSRRPLGPQPLTANAAATELQEQLTEMTDMDPPLNEEEPAEGNSRQAETSAEILESDVSAVLVIDAIDESENPSELLQLLPKQIPAGCFVILSSRPGEHETDFEALPQVHETLSILPRDQGNLDDAVEFLRSLTPEFPDMALQSIAAMAGGNFLFLRLLGHHVVERNLGVRVALDFVKECSKGDGSILDSYYNLYLKRMREDLTNEYEERIRRVNELLGLLAISYEPITKGQALLLLASTWDTLSFDLAYGHIRQFVSEGRCASDAGHDDESTYYIYHDTFRAYISQVLRSDLAGLQQRVVTVCQENMETKPRDRGLRGYAYRHVVKHAAGCRSPHTLSSILQPDFVQKQMLATRDVASSLEDISVGIASSLSQGDLIRAAGLLHLGDEIRASRKSPLAGLQAILKARLGEHDKAQSEATAAGNADILIQVDAEILINCRRTDQFMAWQHVAEIERLSCLCSQEALARCSERIASVDMPLAFELSSRILPPLRRSSGGANGRETITEDDCRFTIIQQQAERNIERVLPLLGETRQAFIASPMTKAVIAGAILKQRPAQAFDTITGLTHLLENDDAKQLLRDVFARYAAWCLDDLDLDGCLCAFEFIEKSSLIPFITAMFPDILDARLLERREVSREKVRRMPQGDAKSFLLWRLDRNEHNGGECDNSCSNPLLQDMMRVDEIEELAGDDPDHALALASDLQTDVGYSVALARVVGSTCDSCSASAPFRQMLKAALRTEHTWSGFLANVALLEAELHGPDTFSPEILSACEEAISSLQPPFSRGDAREHLGRTLGRVLVGWGDSASACFLTVMNKMRSDAERESFAQRVLEHVPDQMMRGIAMSRADYGLSPGITPVGAYSLSPLAQARLLIALAERLIHSDRKLATELLVDATTLANLDEIDARQEYVLARIRVLMVHVAPDTIDDASSGQPLFSRSFLHVILSELMSCQDGQPVKEDVFLRDYCGLALADATIGVDPRRINRMGIESAILEEGDAAPLRSATSLLGLSRKARIANVGRFLSSHLRDMGQNDHCRQQGIALLEALALADWDIFMTTVRKSEDLTWFGQVDSQTVQRAALRSTGDSSTVLADAETIDEIREQERLYLDVDLRDALLQISVAAAEHSPLVLSQILRSLRPAFRLDLLRRMGRPKMSANWTEETAEDLLRKLAEPEGDGHALEGQSIALGWLLPTQTVSQRAIEGICEDALQYGDVDCLLYLAEIVARNYPDLAERLWRPSFDAAISRMDLPVVLDILRRSLGMSDQEKREALNLAREMDAESKDRRCMADIALLQINGEPSDAIAALGSMRSDDAKLDEVTQALAVRLSVNEKSDVEQWVDSVEALGNLGTGEMVSLITGLVRSSPELDWQDSPEILSRVESRLGRVNVCRALANSAPESKRESLLAMAEREADMAEPGLDRGDAMRDLAVCYLDINADHACSLLKKAAESLSFCEYVDSFLHRLGDYVVPCFRLPPHCSIALVDSLSGIVLDYDFGGGIGEECDNAAFAQLVLAVCSATSNPHRSQQYLEMSLEGYDSVPNLVGRLGYESRPALLLNQVCSLQGPELAHGIIDGLRKGSQTDALGVFVDLVCDRLISLGGANEPCPFVHLHVFEHQMREDEARLTSLIIASSSEIVCAKAHLALAIARWNGDSARSSQHIKEAMRILGTGALSSRPRLAEDIGVTCAAILGVEGALGILGSASDGHRIIRKRYPDFIRCLIDQSGNPTRTVHDVWDEVVRNSLPDSRVS